MRSARRRLARGNVFRSYFFPGLTEKIAVNVVDLRRSRWSPSQRGSACSCVFVFRLHAGRARGPEGPPRVRVQKSPFSDISRRPGLTAGSRSRSRRIPAAERRPVWTRDDGRCAFVGADGRCSETGFLEFHHVVPFAAGGPGTLDNLQLRCRAHNAYEARR